MFLLAQQTGWSLQELYHFTEVELLEWMDTMKSVLKKQQSGG